MSGWFFYPPPEKFKRRFIWKRVAYLYQFFLLIALTLSITLWLGNLRFSAVINGDINPKYYELNRGGKIPDYLTKVNQNYNNLLEFPVIFYILIIMLFVMDKVELTQIILAWVFVVSRYIHSYIHTTSNRLNYRANAFIAGVITVIVMWILFLVRFFI